MIEQKVERRGVSAAYLNSSNMNTCVTFTFIDFKQSKPVLILPIVVLNLLIVKVSTFIYVRYIFYIMPRAGRRRGGRVRGRAPPVLSPRAQRNAVLAVEVYNQEEQEPAPIIQVQEPAPDIALAPNVQVQAPAPILAPVTVLQAPVPLQQAPAYVPQAPLAPAHMNNGEINDNPNLIANHSEFDVYISPNLTEKIWNREYIDLALLLYQNCISQVETPQNVVGYDSESGSLVIQPNKQSKVKSIQNIETWTDGFINCVKIFLQMFPNSALELITYMSTIRGTNVQFDKIYRYDQQFRLRMENNPTRFWASIDGILWFTIIANGSSLNTTSPQIQLSFRSCWDYNFKGLCIRQLCNYKHACLKCGLAHPFAYCTRVVNQSYANTPSSVRTVN